MSKKSKGKYYVVWVGQNPGIYNSWSDCQLQIKGFPNAKYKSFKSKKEAEDAFNGSAVDYIVKKKSSEKITTDPKLFENEIIKDSISVDAACSGNPGKMEYRCVETFNKNEIFRMGPFYDGTNNVGEYLALVHALAMLKKNGDSKTIIYSDSRTAMSWVRNKKVKTTLKPSKLNKEIFVLLERAKDWINNNTFETKIIKWDTKKWGEIPADFGRK
ncbi:MAG: reverse transcriptase-like protein [Saprospiraceae bacterium]|nr:reverse transcriptase-like protein [Saprospiraceae bacterium]